MDQGSPRGYAAFISYRHRPLDQRWARWLHRQLETFRVPKRLALRLGVPPRLGVVFRDVEEMEAVSHLPARIEDALVRSRFLVVVCTPDTPASSWVSNEIESFRRAHGDERIIPFLVAGEPAESFPEALRTSRDAQGTASAREPLAADVREASGRSARRVALLRLVARILGCSFDDLRQRDHERRVRRLVALGLTTAALAVTLASLLVFALAEGARAERERSESVRRLGALYEEQGRRDGLEGRTRKALVELAEALKIEPTHSRRFLATRAVRSSAALSLRIDHGSPIQYAAVSPDGRRLITVGHERVAKIWDSVSGDLVSSLSGHLDSIVALAYRTDGRRLLTGSHDSTVRTWDPESGTALVRFDGHERWLTDVVYSPDDRRILTTSIDNTARVWNRDGGAALATLTHPNQVTCGAWSTDGRVVATGCSDGIARLWSLDLPAEPTASFECLGQVTSVALSPDSTRLLVGCGSGAILWDVVARTPVARLGGDGWVRRVGYAKGGRRLLVSRAQGTVVADPDGEVLATLGPDETADAVFGSDGSVVLTGHKTGVARLWDAGSGLLLASFEGHSREVTAVALGPHDRTVFTMGEDGVACVWTQPERPAVAVLRARGEHLECIALSEDGRRVATGGRTGEVDLFEADTGERIQEGSIGGTPCSAIAFRPDGAEIAVSDEVGGIHVLDASSLVEVARLPGHTDRVWALAYHGGTGLLASGSWDGTARVWDARTHELVRVLDGGLGSVSSVAFSPDGSHLVALSSTTARVWDLRSPTESVVLADASTDTWRAPTFDATGARVAVTTEYGHVRVFSTSDGRKLATLRGPPPPMYGFENEASVQFSADGRRLLATHVDMAAIWSVETQRMLVRLDPPRSADRVFPEFARFFADEFLVYVGSGDGGWVYEAATGRLLAEMGPDHGAFQWALRGDRLAVGRFGGTAVSWDLSLAEDAVGDPSSLVRATAPWVIDASGHAVEAAPPIAVPDSTPTETVDDTTRVDAPFFDDMLGSWSIRLDGDAALGTSTIRRAVGNRFVVEEMRIPLDSEEEFLGFAVFQLLPGNVVVQWWYDSFGRGEVTLPLQGTITPTGYEVRGPFDQHVVVKRDAKGPSFSWRNWIDSLEGTYVRVEEEARAIGTGTPEGYREPLLRFMAGSWTTSGGATGSASLDVEPAVNGRFLVARYRDGVPDGVEVMAVIQTEHDPWQHMTWVWFDSRWRSAVKLQNRLPTGDVWRGSGSTPQGEFGVVAQRRGERLRLVQQLDGREISDQEFVRVSPPPEGGPTVLDRVASIVAAKTGRRELGVRPWTKFGKDLDLDGDKIAELLREVEDAFEVQIPDEVVADLHTVGDLVRHLRSRPPQAAPR